MNLRSYSILLFSWVCLVCIAYFSLYRLGLIDLLPGGENLINWDAKWYQSIFQNGYEYIHMKPCNAGFFPFFSLLWGMLGGSAIVMSLVNFALLAASLWYLVNIYAPTWQETLVLVTLPSMFFFYVPYSESLFFLFSTMILIGLKKDKDWWVAAGILFASLTRPSFLFFVPAFGFLFLVDFRKENLWPLVKKYFFFYAVPTILALAIIILAQKIQTDTWFAYFKTQHNVWSRSFRFPTLPFGSTEGNALLWIEAISFWVGALVSGIVFFLSRHFFLKKKALKSYDRTYLFSLVYLMMAFFSIIFFNPVWDIDRSILNGINRYIFASPFLFVVVWNFAKFKSIKNHHFLILLVFSFLVWLFIEPFYQDFLYYFYFLAITGYLFLYAFFLTNRDKTLLGMLVILNVLGQVYMFHRYLGGEWVG